VLARYAGRVVAVRQPNAGETAARNRALEAATGDLVAVLDADDVSAPTRLARQAEELAKAPGAVMCLTGFWRFDDTGRLAEFPANPAAATAGPVDFWTRSIAVGGTLLFDRRRAADLRYPPGVRTGGDLIFLGMLRSRGRCVLAPEPLYGYRVRPGSASLSHTWEQAVGQRLAWVRAHGREYVPELGDDLERRFWFALATELGRPYWLRNRDGFLALRGYLRRAWPPHLPRAPELGWKWYPDWAWNAKEFVTRLVRGR
jgi:glycosyltransferase involved in cell wall biosynthesis